jgi:multidrug efflux pump subunit AcrA (membrane-fusion protein)
MRKFRDTGAGLLAIVLAIAANGCAKHEPAVSAAANANLEATVPAVRVARADLAGAITLTGEFIPFQEVDVMAKVAGYIRNINVDVGDRT